MTLAKFPNLPKDHIPLKMALLCLWAILSFQSLFSQNESIDRLKKKIAGMEERPSFEPQDTVYINLLNKLAYELQFYDSETLYGLAQRAYTLSEEIRYDNGMSRALLNRAVFHSGKGQQDAAIEQYQKALEIANRGHLPNLLLRIKNNLASEYAYKGDYSKSLNAYLESLELAERIGNKPMLSILNDNVSSLYASQKDYDQALAFLKKTKKINNEIGNPIYTAETLSNLADLYAEMGELDYAMFNINKSIQTFEKEKIMDWLAYAYSVKGKVYYKQEKYQWAIYWYNQSELLHTKIQDDRGRLEVINGLSAAHLELNNDSIARHFAVQAYEISETIGDKEGAVSCALTLYKIHKKQGKFDTALQYHEIYQRLSDTLSRNENQQNMTLLKTKLDFEEQKKELIASNEKALAKQKMYVNLAMAFLLVLLVITFIIKRNAKVERKLFEELKRNKEVLEHSEQELKEINETKNKLFSVIAHDLRGPIAAFEGLLKLFREREIGEKEFLGFVPKLSIDIENISFALNNLLSWGQSQMNGAVTKPDVTPLYNLVIENVNLLSEIAKQKSIKIINLVEENAYAWSDRDQINIVIRNLISNALKFTPERGMVTIRSIERNDLWEISIRDTGVGMNRETVDKLFQNGGSYTTYGTNNEKGTGIGLSICKEMVEKNNGTIWVDSIPKKGSCFYFTVSKTDKDTYQNLNTPIGAATA